VPGRLFAVDDGWFEWRSDPAIATRVFVRFKDDGRGRLEVSDLRVTAREGTVTSATLRSIAIGQIEAAANSQLTMLDDNVVRIPTRTRRRARRAPDVLGGWDAPEPRAARPRPQSRRVSGVIPEESPASARRGRSDEFYENVAAVYQELARSSPRPASQIAEANDVPVTTVHRWIKEARRRGILGPGRPGKAG
jgi:hypothetical protein